LSAFIHKGINKEELREGIKETISENPLIGDVIPRTGGVRKVRYAMPGKGKRGEFRIIYYFYDEINPVFLITIYPKSKAENITPKEEKLFAEAVRQLKSSFKNTRYNI